MHRKAANPRTHRSLTGIGMIALLSISPAVADVVHFTNGDRLTGDLVDAPADLVAIDVPEVGIVTVPRTRVARVEEVEPAPPQAGDAASQATTGTTSTDPADRRWEARADLGVAVATGNTRAADLNFVAGVKRHGPRFDNVLGVTVHKARAQADVRRSDAGTTTTKDQVDVDYNLRWKYGEAWYAVANFEYFQDPIKDIDQRATTGCRRGSHLLGDGSRSTSNGRRHQPGIRGVRFWAGKCRRAEGLRQQPGGAVGAAIQPLAGRRSPGVVPQQPIAAHSR